MSVSVIVPSRGPAERLRRLLDSLARQTIEHETIVVDNASSGGAVTACCRDYGFARAITLDRNGGFSAPVNRGAREAAGETLALVNDDCVLEPGFLEALAGAIDPGRSVVMAATVLLDPARPELIDSAGMELDRTLLVYDYLNGHRFGEAIGPHTRDPIGPSAAAAGFDRGAFLAEGGFDERLFAYWEDVDLVLRMRRAGGSCRIATGAVGSHEHSATLGSGSAAKNRLTGYGRGFVLRKWSVVRGARIASVLAREVPIVAGQALVDRTLTGASARIAGWRAFDAEPEPYPADVVERGGGSSLAGTLRRRWERRRRLRARGR
jgi:GT2 family glycosyltransferase